MTVAIQQAMTMSHRPSWASQSPRPWLAGVLGLLAACLAMAEDIGLWWSLRADAAAAVAGQAPWPEASGTDVQATPAWAAASGASPPDGLLWLPGLQTHGLRLLMLEQSAPGPGGARPVLSLTLQGAWRDWLALEGQGAAPLAGWVPQSWQVQALAPTAAAGQVQLQWQLRWSGVAGPLPALGLPPAPQVPDAAEVFALLPTQAEPVAAPATASGRADADAVRWRWLGVWHQAGVSHAVAQTGGRVQVLGVGQRLQPGAAQVQRIEGDRVWVGEGPSPGAVRVWSPGTAP